ncbi:hypothetical protein JTB14_028938 [Gonioctena quinquepunctata]|nr:hypothetical protein JTB14_028938 [Gonioctena quinquepunctata]
MISFITQRAVSKLGQRKSAMSIEIKGIGSMRSQTNNGLVLLEFKPLKQDYPLKFTETVILEKNCDPLPANSLSTHEWSHIQSKNLADPNYYKPGNIDVLLGADIFAKILLNDSITGLTNTPIAISTVLGFILMGKIEAPAYTYVLSLVCTQSEESSLEGAIKQFWEVESIPQFECPNPEHSACEKLFLDTYQGQSSKFTVTLPFRDNNPHPSFTGLVEDKQELDTLQGNMITAISTLETDNKSLQIGLETLRDNTGPENQVNLVPKCYRDASTLTANSANQSIPPHSVLISQPRPNNSFSSSKRKMLLLTDDNGKHLCKALSNCNNMTNFIIESIHKPGGKFADIVESVNLLTKEQQ